MYHPVSYRAVRFLKCSSHDLPSAVHTLIGNSSISQNLCGCWSKLSLLRMKTLFLGTSSALLDVSCLKLSIFDPYPVKLDTFLVASSYHVEEIQRTRQLLTGCQWS